MPGVNFLCITSFATPIAARCAALVVDLVRLSARAEDLSALGSSFLAVEETGRHVEHGEDHRLAERGDLLRHCALEAPRRHGFVVSALKLADVLKKRLGPLNEST